MIDVDPENLEPTEVFRERAETFVSENTELADLDDEARQHAVDGTARMMAAVTLSVYAEPTDRTRPLLTHLVGASGEKLVIVVLGESTSEGPVAKPMLFDKDQLLDQAASRMAEAANHDVLPATDQ